MADQTPSDFTRLRIELAPAARSPAIGPELSPRAGAGGLELARAAQSEAIGVRLAPRSAVDRLELMPPAQSPSL